MKKRIFSSKEWDDIHAKKKEWQESEPSKSIDVFKEYLKKGDKVLDVGCGRGIDTNYFATLGFDSHGIDISKVIIAKAKEDFKKDNLNFHIGSIDKLPFESSSFDAVHCSRNLYHLDLKKAIKEMSRVLKKGGFLFISEILDREFIETGKKFIGVNEKRLRDYTKNFRVIKEKIEIISHKKWAFEDRKIILVLRKVK